MGVHKVPSEGFVLGNKLYDRLKFLAQIGLPALGVLYATLALIWGLPAGEQVSATVLALDTTLGALLGLSSRAYKASDARFDGRMVVREDSGALTYHLVVDDDLEALPGKNELRFKVDPDGEL